MPAKTKPPAAARPGLLTIDEAAEYAQRSRWTLRDLVLDGRLKGHHLDADPHRVYVRLVDVEAYTKSVRLGRPPKHRPDPATTTTTTEGDNPA